MWKLLRENRAFRLLWLGQMTSQFADRLTQLILVALVASVSSGSTLGLAKVWVMTSLPALIVGPVAGVYVDRWDRKRTLVVCDLVRFALILVLPLAAAIPGFFALYAGVFCLFAVGSFFVPARLAIIPVVVPPERLVEANAAFTTSGMIGSAVILLIGALMVEWFGPGLSACVNAAIYLASAAFIAMLKTDADTHPGRGESPRMILTEIWEGVLMLWQHRSTQKVVILLGVLVAGAGASLVVGTVLVQHCLGTLTKDLGFMSLWFGVGMFVGALAYGRWGAGKSRRRVMGLCFIGCGAALGFFLFAVTVWFSGVAASIAAGLLGLFVAPVGILTNTLVHEAHPEKLHGRIFSSLGIVVNLSLICSMLAAGWTAERIGQAVVMAGLAAGFALSGAALLYYKHEQRNGSDHTK